MQAIRRYRAHPCRFAGKSGMSTGLFRGAQNSFHCIQQISICSRHLAKFVKRRVRFKGLLLDFYTEWPFEFLVITDFQDQDQENGTGKCYPARPTDPVSASLS
jgi:hypothetical protein